MRSSSPLPTGHLLLALAVVAVWGSNFVVIQRALEHFPPLTLAALRYAFALLPAVLFVQRPAVRWRTLALYGVAIGVGQFGLLFIAMGGPPGAADAGLPAHARGWISPGMASLVVQTQVFFTVGAAMVLHGERVRWPQAVGATLAVVGLATIAWRGDASATGLGIALVLGAALSWAVGNLVVMRAPPVDMLAFVVWSSAFAAPPLLAMAWAFEGAEAMHAALRGATPVAWAAALWQAVGNTLFGYAAWGWLLARHTAASVTPLALGVPVVGMASSAWWLAEPLPDWKLAGAGLVLAGLVVHVFGARWLARARPGSG